MLPSLWIFLKRVLWVLFAVLLIFFAVNNRQDIVISLEPFGYLAPMPAFWLLFAGIFIGLAAAASVTGWLRLQGFAKRRKAERRASYLEEQVSALAEDAHQHRADKAHTAASDSAAVTDKR